MGDNKMKKRKMLITNMFITNMLGLLILTFILCCLVGCEEHNNQEVSQDILDIENNNRQTDDSYIDENSKESSNMNSNQNSKEEVSDSEKEPINAIEYTSTSELLSTIEYTQAIDDESKMFITIYYQDIEGLLIPVTRRIPKQLSVAKSAMNGLIDASLNRESMSYFGLIPILPKDTEFSINIKDKIAIIDFNSKILDYTNEKSEQNIVTSIVYTLTQFESIDRVKIQINGYQQDKLQYGTDISQTLGRSDVLINSTESDGIKCREGMQKLDLYLLKYVKDSTEVFLVPVSIELTSLDQVKTVDYIMGYLSMYESGQKLFSSASQSIRLINSKIVGSLLILDFNINTSNYGGTFKEYLMVNQILHSMKQLDNISEIKFLLDGKAVALPEGTDLTEPVAFPTTINDIIDEKGYD